MVLTIIFLKYVFSKIYLSITNDTSWVLSSPRYHFSFCQSSNDTDSQKSLIQDSIRVLAKRRFTAVHRIRPNLIIMFGLISGEFESDSKDLKFINSLGCILIIAINDVEIKSWNKIRDWSLSLQDIWSYNSAQHNINQDF